jgi:hypothetical protein
VHSPLLHRLLAQTRTEELLRRSAQRQARARLSADPPTRKYGEVTLRFAFPDDALSLARLAALDSAEPLEPPVLLGHADSELRAALSLTDGRAIADPFYPTDALVQLLRARAIQLGGHAQTRSQAARTARIGESARPRLGG